MNTLSVVHDVLRRQVREGDFCIDATAGKGRDTALLCRLTGENGRVLAFDVQEDAVRQTRELLAKEHLSAEVYRRSDGKARTMLNECGSSFLRKNSRFQQVNPKFHQVKT